MSNFTDVLKKEYENFKYLLPDVKEVLTYDKNDLIDFFRLILKLRKYKFDLAVNLHATFRSAFITYLSGAKLRLVHNHSGKNYFTSLPLQPDKKDMNIIERDLNTLSPLIELKNIPHNLKKTKLIIKQKFDRFIDDEELINTIGLGIGAKRKEKMWGKEKFIELGKKLVMKGFNIAIFCSENEKKEGQYIADGIGNKAKLYVNLDFLRLSYFIKQMVLFIGNDSGLRHIAAALGIKTITLFGPENPGEWHPYKAEDGHIAISHLKELQEEGYDIFSREFREKSNIAISKISVEEVFNQVKNLLNL